MILRITMEQELSCVKSSAAQSQFFSRRFGVTGKPTGTVFIHGKELLKVEPDRHDHDLRRSCTALRCLHDPRRATQFLFLGMKNNVNCLGSIDTLLNPTRVAGLIIYLRSNKNLHKEKHDERAEPPLLW
ncbi:unnamed protein product [Amoebophrya sp. A120]|nr:unnamed protein product [Amoebophrya sp. A120]|eukprot:GSA120T00008167001.1